MPIFCGTKYRYEVDGNIVHIDYFQDNHELAAQGIENSAFSDFINTAEAEFEKHHPTTRKVEKSPVTIGSTVYLEMTDPLPWRKSAGKTFICGMKVSRW